VKLTITYRTPFSEKVHSREVSDPKLNLDTEAHFAGLLWDKISAEVPGAVLLDRVTENPGGFVTMRGTDGIYKSIIHGDHTLTAQWREMARGKLA
jgi:hypothetical protein